MSKKNNKRASSIPAALIVLTLAFMFGTNWWFWLAVAHTWASLVIGKREHRRHVESEHDGAVAEGVFMAVIWPFVVVCTCIEWVVKFLLGSFVSLLIIDNSSHN